MERAMALPVGYERAVPGDRFETRARGIKALARQGDLRGALALLRADREERARLKGTRPGGPVSAMELRERRVEELELELAAEARPARR